MWDDGGSNIRLDQIEFIDMCSVSKDSVFNVAALVFRKGANSLVCCLEHEPKDGHSE